MARLSSAKIFQKTARSAALTKTGIVEALEYRLSQNGRIMPILPLEAGELFLEPR
jgi:hypothetical protein